ncbi:macrophage migration inhibitory factor isoform X2 [Mugil cephalus]|uniref:macrophage migration inhibitory factor isoform X2 n=1 Tax=Mugil cephalus TaxID=48193 RepID=UPI001FB6DE20|nr:macrophage migration inhibitory factor isoform X2 [Mugil cephalus]
MSDYLTKGFKTQLTTTMDSVLRRATFEIMSIFESSLHNHRLELAQKGEEVAQLKIKLQTAELKLKEAALIKTPIEQKQKETERTVDTPGQTSRVPEIDFEVPDDWCAPLGCEIASKQDEGVCPSVENNDFHEDTSGGRRSKRQFTDSTCETALPLSNQRTRLSVRNDVKRSLQDDVTNTHSCQPSFENRKRKARKEQENTEKSEKREQRQDAATEPESKEQVTEENDAQNMYRCKHCKKMFDTEFGRDVHARMHNTCRGCRKIFPLAGAFRSHKQSCAKLQKLLAKQATRNGISKTPSEEKKTPAPNKRQEITQKQSAPSSSTNIELSTQRNKSTKKHSCTYCNKVYDFRYKLQQHVLIHTGEKPFPCSICPRKFRLSQTLKMHMKSKHNLQKNSSKTNRDLAWTKPLEETEDNGDGKDANQEIKANNVRRKRKGKEKIRWQTMGKWCRKGFTCLLCEKLVKNKRALTEHFRLHAGEKPLSCDKCPEKFHTKAQLYVHKKKCSSPVVAF